MKRIQLTMAQALLRFLSQQYVVFDQNEYQFIRSMFAIFGHGNVTGLGEALEYDSHGIVTHRGTNEQGMAHAAIAYAKQRNRLGIIPCTSSIGPGALNMVTAAGVATSNRIPLLLLPGDIFADRQPDPVLQQIEQPYNYTLTANDAFKPVSKYWDRITRPEMLMTAALNAMRVLTCPAETGAVTLCLPQDVQAESYAYPDYFFKKRLWHIEQLTASEHSIKTAVTVLQQAKKPMIIAGGGVHYAHACEQLKHFATQHHIPVAETQAGKSALPWSHCYQLGGVGTTGTSAANQCAQQADVILALGTRLQDFTTASKWLYPHANIIQVNVNSMDCYKCDAIAVKGDVGMVLEQLSKELEGYKTSECYQLQVKQLKRCWVDELENDYRINNRHELMNQVEVVTELNRVIDKEDTIICAAGSLPGDLHRLWCSKQPKDYHLEYGFSCMGYEVAAGLGVALAKQHEGKRGRAYVLVGDGSFLMCHSEIVTAIALKQAFTIILFDNSGYQCIHQLQKSQGSQGFCTELTFAQSNKHSDEDIVPINFKQYAQALGVQAYQAKTIQELNELVKENQNNEHVVLIELKVDPNSMSHGYDSWWRVGVATCSQSKAVQAAGEAVLAEKQTTRDY